VTGATKVKARVISKEAEEEDSQEPRRGSRKPPGSYSQEQSLPEEGLLGLIWANLLLRTHLFH